MQPTLDPQFLQVAARLGSIRWASATGQPLPLHLANWCAPVATAAEALALLESEEWEAWSADRQGALSSYLNLRHQRRFVDWNAIAVQAKELTAQHRTAVFSGLAAAGLAEKVAADTVEWDAIAALTCAAFMDCKPPDDELKLLDIYDAGHLPVGFDAKLKLVLTY